MLAALSLAAAGCGHGPEAAASDPAGAREPIRMVFFSGGSGFAYNDAVVAGARERARRLHVELAIMDGQIDQAKQVRQMRDGITSGKYIGGFVLPIAPELLCDLSTNLAPDHNFMLVVTRTPICDREQSEGEGTWAPGTLAFVSAGQEVSDFSHWGEFIRTHNPGKQKVILLVGPQTSAQAQNADTALRAIERQDPRFQLVDTVHTDFTQQDAVEKLHDVLLQHPDSTIVASIYSELTKSTVQVLKEQGMKNVRVYDVGGDASVLPLIQRGDVQMTTPYYPQTMGATAVQALYDARIGRTPIPRFYANSGHQRPAVQGNRPLLFVTKQTLEQFRADGLSEY
jgi:ribose transport system substrate-binding protein